MKTLLIILAAFVAIPSLAGEHERRQLAQLTAWCESQAITSMASTPGVIRLRQIIAQGTPTQKEQATAALNRLYAIAKLQGQAEAQRRFLELRQESSDAIHRQREAEILGRAIGQGIRNGN